MLASMVSLLLDFVQLEAADVSLVAYHSVSVGLLGSLGSVKPDPLRGCETKRFLTMSEPGDVLDRKALVTPVVLFHGLGDDLLFLFWQLDVVSSLSIDIGTYVK